MVLCKNLPFCRRDIASSGPRYMEIAFWLHHVEGEFTTYSLWWNTRTQWHKQRPDYMHLHICICIGILTDYCIFYLKYSYDAYFCSIYNIFGKVDNEQNLHCQRYFEDIPMEYFRKCTHLTKSAENAIHYVPLILIQCLFRDTLRHANPLYLWCGWVCAQVYETMVIIVKSYSFYACLTYNNERYAPTLAV